MNNDEDADVSDVAITVSSSQSEPGSDSSEVLSGARDCATKPCLATDEDGDSGPSKSSLTAESDRRALNILALQTGSLNVSRKPLTQVLTVKGQESVLRAFKSPVPGATGPSEALQRLVANRYVPRPWGGGMFKSALAPTVPLLGKTDDARRVPDDGGPPPGEPLVLWRPPEGVSGAPIDVDPQLTRWLRPHQREGVQFMFDCVLGLRQSAGFGCILADDMGLGKTLQGITLLWTLLKGGHELLGGNPIAKRVVIVCPTSLVGNWDSECSKWLKGRPLRTMPLCEASRSEVIDSISQFLSPQNYFQVLIISYETFRIHADRMHGKVACDLLICDEAHRLKNDTTLTNRALDGLVCKRRVLLSGTPMQNHLDEFYAMVNFCNPGVLGTPAAFRKRFERPILEGREPGAAPEVEALAAERSAELSQIVNAFILRRTNSLLSAHLPPKVIEVVCCRMTALQQSVYEHFTRSAAARRMLKAADTGKGAGSAKILSAITALKKLCNHPKLIYDAIYSNTGNSADGFEGCKPLFEPGMFGSGRSGGGGRMCVGWEWLSGKMAVAAAMLAEVRATTSDRIVIVSNYTQTLDMFETLCRERAYPVLRLDGSTGMSKRQKLVTRFNDQADNQFVFLLSSKAGGCGLNLVGGNRLILYDPDWNPATDKQAAARVWRDGQKKHVFVYRFLTTGTIEEKVYQRQLSKEGLQSVVNSSTSDAGTAAADMPVNSMSSEELRNLFTLRSDTLSDTYDSVCCSKQGGEALEEADGRESPEASGSGQEDGVLHMAVSAPICKQQVGAPAEEDLRQWGHHSSPATVPDAILARADADLVSFVFSCQVAGKDMTPSPPPEEKAATGQGAVGPPGADPVAPASFHPAPAIKVSGAFKRVTPKSGPQLGWGAAGRRPLSNISNAAMPPRGSKALKRGASASPAATRHATEEH